MEDNKDMEACTSVCYSLRRQQYLAMNVENYVGKKVYYGIMEEPDTIVEYKTEEEELSRIQESQSEMSTEEAMKVMNGDDEE